MWAGPQADVGRWLEGQGVAQWQPVGYNCAAFPLSTGVGDGLREIKRLIREEYPGRPFMVASWSEGAIIYCELLEAMRHGDMQDVYASCWGAVTFGNPYREAGSWAPKSGVGAVPDPGGAGIGGLRNNTRNTPTWQADYAHTGDIYTCCDTGPTGDDMRIIFDFVLTQWSGAIQDLWIEGQELAEQPGQAVMSIIDAVTKAIAFYGGQQRPHQDYDPRPAMNYLTGIARSGQVPTQGGTMSTTTTSGVGFTWNKALVSGVVSFLLTTFVPALLGVLHVVGPIAGAANPAAGAIVGVITAALTWLTKNATKTP
jgi:hypothetical protein